MTLKMNRYNSYYQINYTQLLFWLRGPILEKEVVAVLGGIAVYDVELDSKLIN